jgi:replicative DNA helicase
MNAMPPRDFDADAEPAKNVDIEVEQALLGALLLNPGTLADVSSIIRPESFSERLHQQIYATILDVAPEAHGPLPIILAPLFRDELPIGELTVKQYLGRLAAATPSLLAAKDYAKTVRDLHCRRQLAEAGGKLQALAADPLSSISDVAQFGLSALDDILAAARPSRLHAATLGEDLAQFLDELESNSAPPPVKSGLADLDRMTGGFRRGEFTILAGRPSMGKSAVLIELMLSAARGGHGVVSFSLEMGKEEVSARCLSSAVWNSITPIPYQDIRQNRIVDPWRLREAATRLSEFPLKLDYQPGLTVGEIGVRARRYAAEMERAGKRLDLLILDHLGKVKASTRYKGDKTNETGEVSGALAELAKQLDCAVVAACQLSREVEKRTDKHPELSDLRNSGDLEQDAHSVVFVYRPAYYLERSKRDDDDQEKKRREALESVKHDLELIVAKNRNGPTGTVECFVDIANNVIRNLARAS